MSLSFIIGTILTISTYHCDKLVFKLEKVTLSDISKRFFKSLY